MQKLAEFVHEKSIIMIILNRIFSSSSKRVFCSNCKRKVSSTSYDADFIVCTSSVILSSCKRSSMWGANEHRQLLHIVVRRLSSFACELLCVQIFASIHSTPHILLEAHRYFIFSFEHLLSLVYSKDVCPTTYAKVYKDKTKSP